MAKKTAKKPTTTKIDLSHHVQDIEISQITLSPTNAKVHSPQQINMLADSITRFGLRNPVLLDKRNELIAGEGRLRAFKLLKRTTIPAMIADDLSASEARAYAIADNKLAEFGVDWDEQTLTEELAFLKLNDIDMDVLGFTDAELDQLLPDLEAEADEILDDHGAGDEGKDQEFEAEVSDADQLDDGEERSDRSDEDETQEIDVEKIPGVTVSLPTVCPKCNRPMDEA